MNCDTDSGEEISLISTILWDVDGTLLDFQAAEAAAIRSLFREFGFGECPDEMIRRYSELNLSYWKRLERGELTRQEVLIGRFRQFFDEEGLDSSKAVPFNEKYQIRLGDTIVFRDDSFEVVRTLRGYVKQYAVSNGTVAAQTKKLRVSGFAALMDRVFLSEKIGIEKPDGRFFDAVFEEIGNVNRKEVLIIGDSLTSDILGGMNAGIRTCWYNPEGEKAPETYRIDMEVQDLRELIPLLTR